MGAHDTRALLRTHTHLTTHMHMPIHYSTFTADVNAYANTSAFTVASKIQQSIIDKGTTSKQRLLAEKIPQHTKSTLTADNSFYSPTCTHGLH